MKSEKTKRAVLRRQRRRYTSLALVGLGGLLLVALAVFIIKNNQPGPKVPVEVSGSPRLKVDKEKVDLGDVKLGKVVEVAFTLSNVGDTPLKVSEAPYIEVVEGC
jgi:hypothetical protein